MRIAVLGSWRSDDQVQRTWRSRESSWQLRGTREEFIAACNELGKALARREQVVILGGQSSSTADAHITDGIVAVAGASTRYPLIEVVRPDEDKEAYKELAAKYPRLFAFPPSMQQRWGDSHLVQIRDADSVLAIGGMGGTYQAGLAAIVAKKPLIPIGCFGGAAAKLLASLHALKVSFGKELSTLNGPWTPHALQTAIDLLGIDRKPRLLLIHGRSTDRHILAEWLRTGLGLDDLLIMQEEFGAGRSLPEKFEAVAMKADGAIAIATPDEMGGLAGNAQQNARARQNVWIEVGWIWGRLGRNRVIVLCRGDIEFPSDLQGIEHYQYEKSPLEHTESVRAFLRQLVETGSARS